MSGSCIHTVQLYPSYENNVMMYQTKRGHVRLNISVKEAEFETRYQLWTSTGTCAQCGSALPEEGIGSLAKIKCASTQFKTRQKAHKKGSLLLKRSCSAECHRPLGKRELTEATRGKEKDLKPETFIGKKAPWRNFNIHETLSAAQNIL